MDMEIARNSVFDCHFSPVGRQMAIEKLGDKWASYGHLKNSIWPPFSRHFEYLISFQNFFQLLNF